MLYYKIAWDLCRNIIIQFCQLILHQRQSCLFPHVHLSICYCSNNVIYMFYILKKLNVMLKMCHRNVLNVFTTMFEMCDL